MLHEAYDRLLEAYGPQRWWPVRSRDPHAAQAEIVVGAVLVQNTAWKNVEHALGNLIARDLIGIERLHALPEERLAELIRPAGFYRLKAKRLRSLLRMIVEEHGSLDRLFRLETPALRRALLAVNGVGPETADAILLYAAGRAAFVIDAYTRRVVERHGWRQDLSYDALQQWFERGLPADAALFNEYHALLVEVGKRHCGPAPRCEGCPLRPMLEALPPDRG